MNEFKKNKTSLESDFDELRKKFHELDTIVKRHRSDEHQNFENKLEFRIQELNQLFDSCSKKIDAQISLKDDMAKLKGELELLKKSFSTIESLIKNISDKQTRTFKQIDKIEKQNDELEKYNLDRAEKEIESIKSTSRWRIGTALTVLGICIGLFTTMLSLQSSSMKNLKDDQKDMVQELKIEFKERLEIIEGYLNKAIDGKNREKRK